MQDLKNCADIWKRLAGIYEQQNIMSILNMQGEIAMKEIKKGESVGQYFERLSKISRQLEATEQNLSDI